MLAAFLASLPGCGTEPTTRPPGVTPEPDALAIEAAALRWSFGPDGPGLPDEPEPVYCISLGTRREEGGPLRNPSDAEPGLLALIATPGVTVVPGSACVQRATDGRWEHVGTARPAIHFTVSPPIDDTTFGRGLSVAIDIDIAWFNGIGHICRAVVVDDEWGVADCLGTWVS